MSETTGDKQPKELYPGVYDYSSLGAVPLEQLVSAEVSDWSSGERLHTIGENPAGRFVMSYDAVLDGSNDQTICDLSGLFFIYTDKGAGKQIARTAVDGFSSLAMLLHRYRDKRSYPDLTDPIGDLNDKLASLGVTSRIPSYSHKKRRPELIMPAIEETANELGRELGEKRLERIQETGLFISKMLKSNLRPDHQDSNTWVCLDVFRYESQPVLLAPIGGLAIDMEQFKEPQILLIPDENSDGEDIARIELVVPDIEAAVFGKNGKLYKMPNKYGQQHVPYIKYDNYDDIFRK